ncbi:MAG: (Fe-S)-binding protein [Desulfovibrionaceae bacterium]|nr:(Fe-S)-binding protein [Desulfovibrionaceae bacterium]MBF0513864.1 (Fe-S)-binding protein [Desulfovibrionaceae bacterium]
MADLRRLARMLGEIDDQLVSCMRCGMCQAVCPVFGDTGREADVARGKIALLSQLGSEMIRDPHQVKERLERCLLCGSCAAACPSGVPVVDIFLRARAILTAYIGLSPAKKLIFRGLLARPGLFDRLLSLAPAMQGLFTREVDAAAGTSCARFQSSLIGDRHFKTLAAKPLHELAAPRDEPAGASGKRVALFTGCVVDKVFPQVGQASLAALSRAGAGVYLPGGQACCGIPALSSGDTRTFRKLVLANLELYADKPFDALVTACATCTATIKHVWPDMAADLFNEGERAAIAALAAKTTDICAYLTDVLGVTPVATQDSAATVTYHDPCHLKKSLGIANQPRDLIRANKNLRLVEMSEADVCCGCGGSFNLAHYEISKHIGQRKIANIRATGAQIAATACPACMLQIADMASQSGGGIQVKHAVELYAQGLTE